MDGARLASSDARTVARTRPGRPSGRWSGRASLHVGARECQSVYKNAPWNPLHAVSPCYIQACAKCHPHGDFLPSRSWLLSPRALHKVDTQPARHVTRPGIASRPANVALRRRSLIIFPEQRISRIRRSRASTEPILSRPCLSGLHLTMRYRGLGCQVVAKLACSRLVVDG